MTLYVRGTPAAMKVELLDLSRGGCFLATPVVVALRATATISFVLRPATGCTARGCVVRVEGTKGFGVQFEEANHAFERFLDDLAALRPDLREDLIAQALDRVVRVTY